MSSGTTWLRPRPCSDPSLVHALTGVAPRVSAGSPRAVISSSLEQALRPKEQNEDEENQAYNLAIGRPHGKGADSLGEPEKQAGPERAQDAAHPRKDHHDQR